MRTEAARTSLRCLVVWARRSVALRWSASRVARRRWASRTASRTVIAAPFRAVDVTASRGSERDVHPMDAPCVARGHVVSARRKTSSWWGCTSSALGAAPPVGLFDSFSGSVILGCRWRWAPGVRAGDRGWGDVVPCSVWDASGPSVRPGAPAATARRNWRRHSLRSLTLGPGATFPSTLRATVAPSASPWSSSFPASTHTKGEPP